MVIYLVTPIPIIPDLDNSVKSNLPGDTTQITNVSSFFTNLSRSEVMDFYKKYYPKFFRTVLNHPPEKAKDIFLDTTQSYYLEELVLPFKESLYINGFEWENDVFTKPENRPQNKIIYENQLYKSKITIRYFPTSIPIRLITFFSTEISLILTFLVYKSFLKK